MFAVVAAVRAQQSGEQLRAQGSGTRGERAVAAVTWTSSVLMVAAVITFVLVTVVALWLAGG